MYRQQVLARESMDKHGVRIESWGPFAEGRKDLFTNSVLKGIGDRLGKSVAQVALRFLIQRGVVIIPKSTHRERMEENFRVFDFALSDENVQAVSGAGRGTEPLLLACGPREGRVAEKSRGAPS